MRSSACEFSLPSGLGQWSSEELARWLYDLEGDETAPPDYYETAVRAVYRLILADDAAAE